MHRAFFVTVRVGTAYRHLFSKVKEQIICSVYGIRHFRLVSTGTYFFPKKALYMHAYIFPVKLSLKYFVSYRPVSIL